MLDYVAMLTPDLERSFPEETDYVYPQSTGPFLPFIDLKPDVFEVDDQLSVGSCTANAVTSLLEYMLKQNGRGLSLSRLFNYWVSRNIIQEQPGINGSTVRAAVRAAKHFGVCKEITWPYNISSVDTKPADGAFSEAITRVIQRYEIIYARDHAQNIRWVKTAINEKMPVVFTCALGKQWLKLTGPWRQHIYGLVTYREGDVNQAIGRHAMLVIGYDDASQRFLIENSWGPTWGDGGFGGMPYNSFASSFQEGFVIRGFDGIYINDPLQSQWDWIQKLYLGFYGRPADLGGMLYWRDRLIAEGLGSIVEAFMTSDEAQILYSTERIKEANEITRRTG